MENEDGWQPFHVGKERRTSYLLKCCILIESFEDRWLVISRLHDHEAGFPRRSPLPVFRGLLGFLYDGRVSPFTRCPRLEVGPVLFRRGPHFLRGLAGRARCCHSLLSVAHVCLWGCHTEREKSYHTTEDPPTEAREMRLPSP